MIFNKKIPHGTRHTVGERTCYNTHLSNDIIARPLKNVKF